MRSDLVNKADLWLRVDQGVVVPRHHRLSPQDARRLGQRLRTAREERGLTQEEVALAAGLNRNHYQLLEQGRAAVPSVQRKSGEERPSNPTLATLIELSRVLDIHVGLLVVDTFGPPRDIIVEYLACETDPTS